MLPLAQPAHHDLAARPVTRDGSVPTHYRTCVEGTCLQGQSHPRPNVVEESQEEEKGV